jgi:hypothetical protein
MRTNSKTVSTKPITKREKTAMAGYRMSNVVIVLPHQSAQLEVDAKRKNGRNPNSRKNSLLLVFDNKPQIG